MGSTDILFTTDTTDVSSSVTRCVLLKIKVFSTQIQFQPTFSARPQIFDVVAKAHKRRLRVSICLFYASFWHFESSLLTWVLPILLIIVLKRSRASLFARETDLNKCTLISFD